MNKLKICFKSRNRNALILAGDGRMKRAVLILAALTLLLGGVGQARAGVIVYATSEGWINAGGGTNYSPGVINNTYASEFDGYRDIFQFNLPIGTITGATINIWNDERNFPYDSGTFN